MTGLKSGSGDDLWADDGDDGDDEEVTERRDRPADADASDAADAGESDADEVHETDEVAEADSAAVADPPEDDGPDERPQSGGTATAEPAAAADDRRPYIVRRAVQDKSVQFERDERLTFFVHDDVAEGERDLQQEVETALGRDVPKFDIREAVYRAALENREDVLAALVEMGYSTEE